VVVFVDVELFSGSANVRTEALFERWGSLISMRGFGISITDDRRWIGGARIETRGDRIAITGERIAMRNERIADLDRNVFVASEARAAAGRRMTSADDGTA
jgi:hypothetical protein